MDNANKNVEIGINDDILLLISDNKIDEALNMLDKLPPSQAYECICKFKPLHTKLIRGAGKEVYQRFQDVCIAAKKSWEYDHKPANIAEVNKACMNVYTLLLRILKRYSDGIESELSDIKSAINKIEEKVGLDITKFSAEEDGVDNNVDDVQGIEKNI